MKDKQINWIICSTILSQEPSFNCLNIFLNILFCLRGIHSLRFNCSCIVWRLLSVLNCLFQLTDQSVITGLWTSSMSEALDSWTPAEMWSARVYRLYISEECMKIVKLLSCILSNYCLHSWSYILVWDCLSVLNFCNTAMYLQV